MNGIDFIADTNILLLILAGNDNVKQYEGSHFGISVITEIELMGWYKITTEHNYVLEGLIRELTVFPLNDMIKDTTIYLKQHHKIKTPDAVIGATSKWLNIPLLTADNDFKSIKELDAIIVDI